MVTVSSTGSLAGRHVLVTGGAKGIGEGIVRGALLRGAQVTCCDIDGPGGRALSEQLRAEHGAQVPLLFAQTDVTDFAQVTAAVAAGVAAFGPVLGLVNNAGRNSYADPVAMTEQEWDDFFDLDLKSTWLMCKAVLPLMRAAGTGSIVQIASVHARMTYPNYFPYAAAKSGLVGLTRNLALDEGRHGIRVNAVSPGYTLTPMLRDYFRREPAAEQQALAVHPLGVFAEPRDIANVVCFLLSDEARFVTGADWLVDGGLTARFAG